MLSHTLAAVFLGIGLLSSFGHAHPGVLVMTPSYNGFLDCDQNSLYVDDSRTNNVLRCRLNQQPSADTTLYFESRALRFSTCTLVFTTTNWNVYQDIPVMPSAPRFGQASASAAYQINFRASSTGSLNGQTSIIIGKINRQMGISCVGTGYPHYRSIFGEAIFHRGIGTYHMIKTDKLNVQVVQVPGPRNAPIIHAVSVAYGNNVALYDVRGITDNRFGMWQKLVSDQANFILTQRDKVACVELPDGSKILITDNWSVEGRFRDLGVSIHLASSQSGVTGGVCAKPATVSWDAYIGNTIVGDNDNHFLGRYTRGTIDQSMLICAIPAPGSTIVTSIPLNPAITSVPVYSPTLTLPTVIIPTVTQTLPILYPSISVVTSTVTTTSIYTISGTTLTTTLTAPVTATVTVVVPTTTTVPMVYPTTYVTTFTVPGSTVVSTVTDQVTITPTPTVITVTSTATPIIYTQPATTIVTLSGTTVTSTLTNIVTVTPTPIINTVTVTAPVVITQPYTVTTTLFGGTTVTQILTSLVTVTPTTPIWPPVYSGVISNSPIFATPSVPAPDQNAIRGYCESALNIPGCTQMQQRPFYVNACVADIIVASTYDIGEAIKRDFIALCKAWTDYGRRDPSNDIARNSTQEWIRAGFGNNTCINSCSNNGQCTSLGCYCNPGFGGADCSINTSTLPKLPGSDGLVLISPGIQTPNSNGTMTNIPWIGTPSNSPILSNHATPLHTSMLSLGLFSSIFISIITFAFI